MKVLLDEGVDDLNKFTIGRVDIETEIERHCKGLSDKDRIKYEDTYAEFRGKGKKIEIDK